MYVGKHIVKKNKKTKEKFYENLRAGLKPPKKERKYADIYISSNEEMKYCLFRMQLFLSTFSTAERERWTSSHTSKVHQMMNRIRIVHEDFSFLVRALCGRLFFGVSFGSRARHIRQ